jgi:hypothetical protein
MAVKVLIHHQWSGSWLVYVKSQGDAGTGIRAWYDHWLYSETQITVHVEIFQMSVYCGIQYVQSVKQQKK